MESITQEPVNVYKKILTIMETVQRLEKDTQVKFGQTNYTALSEEKVTEILREQMIKNKLVVFPVEMYAHRDGQISHVDVKYRIADAETGDFIEVVSCGDGADSQDKGAGKAMTYAYKYMWLRTFAIPTGEDPDKISSDQLDAEQKKDEVTMYRCADCGEVITPHGSYGVMRIAENSKQRFGRMLCWDCAGKAKNANE